MVRPEARASLAVHPGPLPDLGSESCSSRPVKPWRLLRRFLGGSRTCPPWVGQSRTRYEGLGGLGTTSVPAISTRRPRRWRPASRAGSRSASRSPLPARHRRYTAGAIRASPSGSGRRSWTARDPVFTRLFRITDDIRQGSTLTALWGLAEETPAGAAAGLQPGLMELGAWSAGSVSLSAAYVRWLLLHAYRLGLQRNCRSSRPGSPCPITGDGRGNPAGKEILLTRRRPRGSWEVSGNFRRETGARRDPGGLPGPGIREELGIAIEVGPRLRWTMPTPLPDHLHAFACLSGRPHRKLGFEPFAGSPGDWTPLPCLPRTGGSWLLKRGAIPRGVISRGRPPDQGTASPPRFQPLSRSCRTRSYSSPTPDQPLPCPPWPCSSSTLAILESCMAPRVALEDLRVWAARCRVSASPAFAA